MLFIEKVMDLWENPVTNHLPGKEIPGKIVMLMKTGIAQSHLNIDTKV